MNRKAFSGIIVLTMLLTGMLTLTFNIKPAKGWTGTVYIRADGSIDPPTAPISTVDYVNYIFADNIFSDADGIVVERNNIIIDGNGYTLQGTGSYPSKGIDLTEISNVTIKNIKVKAFYTGIDLARSSSCNVYGNNVTNNNCGIKLTQSFGNSISNNNITNNENGILLGFSSSNSLKSNSMTGNDFNFGVDGIWSSDFVNDVDVSNTVDGKPIYYWVNRQNLAVPLNAGFVALIDCTNITIKGLELRNNHNGILLAGTINSVITENTVTNNYFGIMLTCSSEYNSISGNNIVNNWNGVILQWSPNNMLRDNNMVNDTYGIGVYGLNLSEYVNDVDMSNTINGKPVYYWINKRNLTVPPNAGYVALVNCTRITIQHLNLTSNEQGVLLAFTTNSTITKSNVTDNRFGIWLDYSSDNVISKNDIANNEYGVRLTDSSNNTVSGNNITANNVQGIRLWESSNNRICHNNFADNTQQVYSYDSVNVWDDGYPSGGNYWSDYTGVDADGDGIGDTPYNIDADNQDRYPLMNPWGCGTPVASFVWSPSILEVDELVTFDASASMPIGGEIVSYEWDFGDGNYASGNLVTHRYSSAGNYTVTLNVTDSEGLWDIEQKQIEVKAPPPPLKVSISPTSASIIVGQSVTFTSTVSGGYTPYTYQWYLNGVPVSGANQSSWTFTPTEAGIYYVYLKVTDAKGNTTQSETARITVSAVPVGGYSIPIKAHTKTEPIIPYIALITMLTAIFIKVKRKTKRKR